jgi:hypothetical protein
VAQKPDDASISRCPVLAELPYLDEHATVIEAGVDDVWAALLETLDRAFSGAAAAAYARAVGCTPSTASGERPLGPGSTIPGFQVITASPHHELVLAGRHRFSSYALIFRLDEVGPRRSRLCAESRAAFPAVLGRLYRLLVVGTGGHVLGVRRLLAAIRRRSESPPRAR